MIDCHVHFWSYNKEEFPWIRDRLQPVASDMTPDKLWQHIDKKIDKIIAVQARAKINENQFLYKLAKKNNKIKGIIGWFNFDCPADIQIETALQDPIFKGFRHLIQDEPCPSGYLLHHPGINKAMNAIQSNKLVYEVLIHQKDLNAAVQFCKTHDQHYLVIDHLAKPIFSDQDAFVAWKQNIQEFQKMDHVIMKISGLVTEGGENAHANMFQRHIDTVVETFGTNRLVWGSDWPVSFATHDYSTLIDFWNIWTKDWNDADRLQVEEENPQRVYRV